MNSDNKYKSQTFKKKLLQRISSIKAKKHMKNIFTIIYKNDESYTHGASGVWLDLTKYKIETLKEIEEYLDENFPQVDLMPIDVAIKTLSDTKSDSCFSVKEFAGMTNQEKNFLKKLDSDTKKNNNLIPSLS